MALGSRRTAGEREVGGAHRRIPMLLEKLGYVFSKQFLSCR